MKVHFSEREQGPERSAIASETSSIRARGSASSRRRTRRNECR
jgi:hypothetical protein